KQEQFPKGTFPLTNGTPQPLNGTFGLTKGKYEKQKRDYLFR
ncbi:MAG: hypothetical protein ACI976_003188, partial [Aureispira sp.]